MPPSVDSAIACNRYLERTARQELRARKFAYTSLYEMASQKITAEKWDEFCSLGSQAIVGGLGVNHEDDEKIHAIDLHERYKIECNLETLFAVMQRALILKHATALSVDRILSASRMCGGSVKDFICFFSANSEFFTDKFIKLMQTFVTHQDQPTNFIYCVKELFESPYFDKKNHYHQKIAMIIFKFINEHKITQPEKDLFSIVKTLLDLKGKPYGFFSQSSKVEFGESPLMKNPQFLRMAFETLRNIAGETKNQFMVNFYLNACAKVNAPTSSPKLI